MAEDGQDGCKGPDSVYIKLVASDGHEFIVKRKHALLSKTIKQMLSGPGEFAEHETNEIHFKEYPSHILQQICMYLSYKACYENCLTGIPGFVVPPKVALELLEAAKFLQC